VPRFLSKNANLLKAAFALAGTTIGAGIFGMPYVTAKVGLPLGLGYLLILGLLTLIVNLAYGEVILRTRGDHQFTGYAQKYLGSTGKWVASLVLTASLYGSLLAYLVKTGEFLSLLFPQWLTPSQATLIFFTLAAWTIFYGLKTVSVVESYLTVALVGFLFFLILICSVKIDPLNWITNTNFDYFFLPYGLFIFSLAGSLVIPEMEEILRQEPQKLRTSIIWGTLAPVFIYAGFIIAVVGVTGPLTSDDTIRGLAGFFSPPVVSLSAVIGLLAIATSFLTLGYVLREHFYRDFRLAKNSAWAMACAVPLGLFLLGANNFILILSLTGALAIGLQNGLILAMSLIAKKIGDKKPAYQINLNDWVALTILLVFIGGMLYEVLNLLRPSSL